VPSAFKNLPSPHVVHTAALVHTRQFAPQSTHALVTESANLRSGHSETQSPAFKKKVLLQSVQVVAFVHDLQFDSQLSHFFEMALPKLPSGHESLHSVALF